MRADPVMAATLSTTSAGYSSSLTTDAMTTTAHYSAVSTFQTRSLDDLDLGEASTPAIEFERSRSLRGSRKSLKSVGSEDDILEKVGEIEHKDPFKRLKSESGGHFAVRKTTKVTKLVRRKSQTSLFTDSEPNDDSSSSSSSDEEEDEGLQELMLEVKRRKEHELLLERQRLEAEERKHREQDELEIRRREREEYELKVTIRRRQEEERMRERLHVEAELAESRRREVELAAAREREQFQAELLRRQREDEEREMERRRREEEQLEIRRREEERKREEERIRLEEAEREAARRKKEAEELEMERLRREEEQRRLRVQETVREIVTTEERFSFASSQDTVRPRAGSSSSSSSSSSEARSRTSSTRRRTLSSVQQPDYYKYAWGTIRDAKGKDENDAEYWQYYNITPARQYWRLRVLQDRGLMSSEDNYRDYMPEDIYNRQNQQQTVTTVTKVITNREIQAANPQTPNESQSYINYTYTDNDRPAPSPRLPSPRSPGSSVRDAPTPTYRPQDGYRDQYDSLQQNSYRQDYSGYNGGPPAVDPPSKPPSERPYTPQQQTQNGPYGSYNPLPPQTNIAPSPRPSNHDDSFHGNRGYTTTTTTTTVDQYGSSSLHDDRQYSTNNNNQSELGGYHSKAPSERPMDSPRSDRFNDRGPPFGSVQRLEAPPLVGAPGGDPDRRSPSINSTTRGMDIRYRNPDLPEVIEFLSHHNDMVKANAAAYLQHLCYMDDDTKTKTRGLGGIPPLVDLVNSDIPEVHRAACGALKNLSYGRSNEENKKAIKNAGGIPALVRLLRKTPDNDVRELVTGILWNLSSLKDLKRPIIDDGLTVLVNSVIVPHSGWDPQQPASERKPARDVYWSTVFRNASGVLRNVSSDGQYSRTKLRECDGLVDAIVFIVQAAIGKSDIDNKSVENCVCVLRNLSYACQEVHDKQYLVNRAHARNDRGKGDSTGCFGGGNKKKKDGKDPKSRPGASNPAYQNPVDAPRGMGLLWHPTIVPLYLPLLYDCTNPETLEAAAGAIQNLAACDWQPSDDIRETVRKQKGLPVLVELLNLEADKVVCAAATALRNLSLDPQSKELIGKYAMRQLVMRLPDEQRSQQQLNEETICALEALIYEVIKANFEFAQSLLSEGGVDRLMFIVRTEKYEYRVRKYASSILTKMWEFKELHSKYRERGWKDVNFLVKPQDPTKKNSPSKSLPSSAENTLNRPRMDQSGPTVPGYNENTLPYVARQPVNNTLAREHGGENHYTRTEPGRGPQQYEPEEIPMTNLAPQPPAPGPGQYGAAPEERTGAYSGPQDSPSLGPGGYYASVDLSRQDGDQYRHTGPAPHDDSYRGNPPHDDSYRGNPPHDDSYRAPAPHDESYRGGYQDDGYRDNLPPSPAPADYRQYRHDDSAPPSDYTGTGRADSYRQMPGGGGYPEYPSPRDDRSLQQDDYRPPADDYRPPGGVPMFPNLGPAPPGRQTPSDRGADPRDPSREPLYARVVKPGQHGGSGLLIDHNGGSPGAGGPPGGADSWV